MLKSLFKPTKNMDKIPGINKNITSLVILLLVLVMILIIFWNIFKSIFNTRFLQEGLDPDAPLPVKLPVAVTMTDNTPSNIQVDPNAFGTFYLTTENNINNLNIVTMGMDASNINIDFDAKENTKLLLFPTKMPQTNPHKANLFPVNFTLNVSFPDVSGNINTKYVDVSGDDYRNSLKYYMSPNGDVSGNFVNIVLGIQDIQCPIYENIKSQKDIGNVKKPSKNKYVIDITSSGNTINGIVVNLKPPV